MRSPLALFLSLRMLRGRDGTARYLRGSAVGIALSLIPLIVVMEVSTGMIQGITTKLLEVGTYHVQAVLAPGTRPQQLLDDAAAVAAIPGVTAAVPERQGTGLLVTARSASGVSVRCVPPDVFSRDPGFRSNVTIRAGTARLDNPNVLLVSAALSASLGLVPGDQVNLLTTFNENMSGPPRLTPLVVGGIYETGYQELDKSLVYAPLPLASRALSPRASRVMIGIKVREPFGDLEAVASAISARLHDNARVATWQEIEYPRMASFRTTRALLLFIMALIVLVASVNVSSSVLMIIFERRSDIGILKSVGIGEGPLSRAFLFTGFSTGLLGTAGGIAAGLLVAVNINEVIAGLEWIVNRFLQLVSLVRAAFVAGAPPLGAFTLFNSAYYLKSIPIRINASDVVAAAAATLLLCACASYIPALRAARTRPLEILHKV